MSLNYNKLIQFDLLDEVEKNLDKNREKFIELFLAFQNISSIDNFIRDCPSFPGSNSSIIRDELVSVIGSTLAIEGIVIKEEDIKEGIRNPTLTTNPHTINSQNVYDYIRNTVRTVRQENQGVFTYKDEYVIDIHRRFTVNIYYPGNKPGAYRNTNATFGEQRRLSLCQNYTEIYTAMKNYIDWLNQKKEGILTSNIIAKAIMAHYYLTEIHPFGDGNGRTARAVEAMVLYANGINPYCFWSLANFWSANRNEYIAHLGNIRETCDPLDFLIWGAKGYFEIIKGIKGRVLKKLKYLMLRDYVSWLFKNKKTQEPTKKINQRIRDIVFLLTDFDKISLDKFRASPQYESLYSHRSNASKSRDFSKMKSSDLIRISEVDGKEFIEPNYDILEKLEYRLPTA